MGISRTPDIAMATGDGGPARYDSGSQIVEALSILGKTVGDGDRLEVA